MELNFINYYRVKRTGHVGQLWSICKHPHGTTVRFTIKDPNSYVNWYFLHEIELVSDYKK